MPTLSSSNANHRTISPLPPRINTNQNNGGFPLFNSIVSQVTGVEHARARYNSSISTGSSPASSTTDDDGADVYQPTVPHSQLNNRHISHRSPLDTRNNPALHPSIESFHEPEIEFAAAVLFVESYQGPHRILQQEQSAPKIGLYALYHQATVGPCPTQSSSTTPLEVARYEKWKSLGNMTRSEAMKQYTSVLDNLVDDWRRSAGLGKPTTIVTTAVGPTPPRVSVYSFVEVPLIYTLSIVHDESLRTTTSYL